MKKQIALYLLLILAIFLVSCNDATNSEAPDTPADTTEKVPEETASAAADDSIICSFPSYPEYRLKICDLAIVEWGDVVDLDICHKDANESDEYVGVGVNYIKTFDSTAYLTSEVLRERILNYPERRYAFIDAEHREAFMQNHEDILLLPAGCADEIEKGTTALIYILTDGSLPLDSITSIDFLITPHCSDGYLEALPIIDNKIILPEHMKNIENSAIYSYMMFSFNDCNEKLIQLGLDDNLFRDGMTVEELDAYFELVTKKETFAPLFED